MNDVPDPNVSPKIAGNSLLAHLASYFGDNALGGIT